MVISYQILIYNYNYHLYNVNQLNYNNYHKIDKIQNGNRLFKMYNQKMII